MNKSIWTNKNLSLLIIVLSFLSCQNHEKNTINGKIKKAVTIDTTKSFRLDTFWVTPKPSLEFSSLAKSSLDTLDLVINTEYVYSPFGILKDKSDLKSSLLGNFSIVDKTDLTTGETLKLQSLKLKNSKLILFFDKDPEASRHSYIIKGEIYDDAVNFSNAVKVGMSKKDFYNIFFDSFASSLQKKYSVVAFESGVEDIRHVYSFKNDKLYSVKFNCVDCTWKIDY